MRAMLWKPYISLNSTLFLTDTDDTFQPDSRDSSPGDVPERRGKRDRGCGKGKTGGKTGGKTRYTY